MSEYQYYEFQAIDRALTKDEMAELRALTSRATITPTRLQNVYHWGDFKGNPLTLMERYFDAFVYVTNWGTRQLMLRLPRRVLDPKAVWPYCVGDSLDLHVKGDYVILDFQLNEEGGGDWVEDEEAEGWMPSLIPMRADLASGDLRALYLAWLSAIPSGASDDEESEWPEDEEVEELKDKETEPPVPPGLGRLSASLEALAEFLDVDRDLIAVAAENSAELRETRLDPRNLERWIRDLPEADKVDLLARLVRGDEPNLRGEVLLRYRRSHEPAPTFNPGRRTVGELRAAAERHTAERKRAEAEQAARERERRQRDEAAARAVHLDGLVGREEDLWRQVEGLVEVKRAAEYDEALRLLKDLRDLSVRGQSLQSFTERLNDLRLRHSKKPAFIARLDRARLNTSKGGQPWPEMGSKHE